MESVSLWIALTPEQFSTLNSGKEIEPDPYSQRFGLRTSPGEAIDRAQYFMDWTPEGMKGEHHQKEFTVCQVEISALGYMQKMEAGTLAKTKPGEYRWYGTMKHEERDDQGRVLYRFSDTAAQVLWRHGAWRRTLTAGKIWWLMNPPFGSTWTDVAVKKSGVACLQTVEMNWLLGFCQGGTLIYDDRHRGCIGSISYSSVVMDQANNSRRWLKRWWDYIMPQYSTVVIFIVLEWHSLNMKYHIWSNLQWWREAQHFFVAYYTLDVLTRTGQRSWGKMGELQIW